MVWNMRKYEYDYTIYPDNSPEQFEAICVKLDELYSDYSKRPMLVDVDGTTIQVYEKNDKRIVVYDDYDIGAVFVKSDIRISMLE